MKNPTNILLSLGFILLLYSTGCSPVVQGANLQKSIDNALEISKQNSAGSTGYIPKVLNPTSIPPIAEQQRSQILPEYRIQPGEELEIKLVDYPQLNESVVVRPDGRISVQLANEVMVAGKTPSEVRDILAREYATELKQPRISVIMRQFNSPKVFVGGEVKHPQAIVLQGNTTALQAIIESGGLESTARTNEVILIRRSPNQPVSAYSLNLDLALNGSDPKQDILLMPSDVIFVPKSDIADLNQYIDQHIRRMMPLDSNLNFSQNQGSSSF